jgi:hypothetical protein
MIIRPIPPDLIDDPHQQRGHDVIGQFAIKQIQMVGAFDDKVDQLAALVGDIDLGEIAGRVETIDLFDFVGIEFAITQVIQGTRLSRVPQK